jgi:MFS family permease
MDAAVAKASGSYSRDYPIARRAWWALTVFAICAVMSYTDRYILSMLVDPIRQSLKISDAQISLLQGMAFAAIYSCAGLPLGRLADRGPRRALMLAGVICWTAGTAACGLANSFSSLFLARILVGAGEAALAPTVFSMIGDLFPAHRRGMAIAVFLAAATAGQGASLVVGGALLHLAEAGSFAGLPIIGTFSPWRCVLLALAPPGLLAAALLLTVKEPRRLSGAPNCAPLVTANQAFMALLERRRVVVPVWVALAFGTAGDAAFSGWTPTLLSRVYQQHSEDIGGLLGVVYIVAGVVGTLVGGFVGDRLDILGGPSRRLAAAAAASALAILSAIIFVHGCPLLVIICFAVWVLLFNFCQVVSVAALQELLPGEMRGLNVACIAFVDLLFGSTCGTGATAILTQYVFRNPAAVGLSIALVAVAASAAPAFLFWRAAQSARETDFANSDCPRGRS